MGVLWSFITPLFLLAIFTFVFKYVFKARWSTPGIDGAELNFAMMLFMGLIIHGMISDVLSRSPTLILSNVNFVKKVVFPLEILSLVTLLGSLFNFLISFMLLLAMVAFELSYVPLTVFLLPFVILPYIVFLLGLSWILAALGVYVRDIQHVTASLTTLLLFLSPVFYSIDILPLTFQTIIYLNPIALIVEECRAVVIFGEAPDLKPIFIYSVVSVLVAFAGFHFFQRTRKGFADVL